MKHEFPPRVWLVPADLERRQNTYLELCGTKASLRPQVMADVQYLSTIEHEHIRQADRADATGMLLKQASTIESLEAENRTLRNAGVSLDAEVAKLRAALDRAQDDLLKEFGGGKYSANFNYINEALQGTAGKGEDPRSPNRGSGACAWCGNKVIDGELWMHKGCGGFQGTSEKGAKDGSGA